jgi:hypothetical protein
MGWSIGYDSTWDRDIGYGVPACCDHPKCAAEIDRGLSYVCCDSEPYGGAGCGLYFCAAHRDSTGKCPRCAAYKPPYKHPKPDHPEWIAHKLHDPSWAQWRAANAEWVRANALAKNTSLSEPPE